MISNHYPMSFASRWNWLIFAIVLVVGARHPALLQRPPHGACRTRGGPGASPRRAWRLIVLLSAGGPSHGERAAVPPEQEVTFADVEAIVLGRCSMCHAAEPLWPGMASPPKGVCSTTPS